MVVYRTVIWKDPTVVNIPSGVDRTTFETNHQTWLSDFETNYKSLCTPTSERLPFDQEIDYDSFKLKIDGTTITWSDVLMFEYDNQYILTVVV